MATDKSFASNITRLKDPNNVAASPRQLHELQEMISSCMTRMFQHGRTGGNAFLFSLCGPKPHMLVRELHGQKIDTAATDGKTFYWNPEFLASMNADQVQTVMAHESYHVLFYHTSRDRSAGKDPRPWNIAVDYVVNGVIELDHEKSQRCQKFKVWDGPLGSPITLQDYKDWCSGKREDFGKGPNCFADPTLHGRSPESIYNDIITMELASPRRCKENAGGCGALSIDPKTGVSKIPQPWDKDACQKCGAKAGYGPGSLDGHLGSALTKEEVMGEMMRAAEQAAATGRGTAPAEVEGALAELKTPTLRASDIIKQAFMRKTIDVGNKNDWKRLRRRQLAMTPRQFLPRKHDHFPTYLAFFDTSGSMSDADIAAGISELQILTPARGVCVPMDAKPYWDAKQIITRASDLKRIKVVGRGGTVFEEAFRDYPKEVGTNFDVVIVITDGDCGHIPLNLRPQHAETVWIITNKREFKPTFGRVCSLDRGRI